MGSDITSFDLAADSVSRKWTHPHLHFSPRSLEMKKNVKQVGMVINSGTSKTHNTSRRPCRVPAAVGPKKKP